MTEERWPIDKDVEHVTSLDLYDEEGELHSDVPLTIHNVKLDYSDACAEFVGIFTISIEGSKSYQRSEFYVWGNGADYDDEEEQADFDGCYVCLPTMMEEEPQEWDSERDGEYDELFVVSLDDMLHGIELD